MLEKLRESVTFDKQDYQVPFVKVYKRESPEIPAKSISTRPYDLRYLAQVPEFSEN